MTTMTTSVTIFVFMMLFLLVAAILYDTTTTDIFLFALVYCLCSFKLGMNVATSRERHKASRVMQRGKPTLSDEIIPKHDRFWGR